MFDALSKFNPTLIVRQLEEFERLVSTGNMKSIPELQRVITELSQSAVEIRKLIGEAERVNLMQLAVGLAYDEATSVANDFLVDEINKALQINSEYDHPVFKEGLIEAAMNPRSIKLSLIDNKLIVRTNLNATAGTLEQWANGVDAARRHIPTYSSENPERSSTMWAEKLYGVAREGKSFIWKSRNSSNSNAQKYWLTIMLRFKYSRAIAPYWQLLDKGAVSLSSDIGGTPYPHNIPTKFTTKTIYRIKKFFENLKSEYLRGLKEEINSYTKKLIQTEGRVLNIIRELQSMLLRVSVELSNETKRKELISIKLKKYWQDVHRIEGDIISTLGNKADIANAKKIRDVARAIVSGRFVPARVGLGNGVRIRTKALIGKYK